MLRWQMQLHNGVEEDADATLTTPTKQQSDRAFAYPTGYSLKEGDPLYTTIHEIRERTGWVLHEVHRFLSDKQEDDVPCFGALYSAYRSWFVDVGIERSAHVLDRVTRLLAADIHPYKMSGIRKDYPRPFLSAEPTCIIFNVCDTTPLRVLGLSLTKSFSLIWPNLAFLFIQRLVAMLKMPVNQH